MGPTYSKINSEYYARKVIDFEEYDKDISEIKLQHDLATMTAKLDLFVRSIKEKDNKQERVHIRIL